MAVVFAMVGQEEVANACWIRHRVLQPTNEAAIRSEAMFRLSKPDHLAGLPIAAELLKVNPHYAQYHWLNSQFLQQSGQSEEAIRAAENAVNLDPTDISIREWLRDMYAKTGKSIESKRHREVLDRMNQTNSTLERK